MVGVRQIYLAVTMAKHSNIMTVILGYPVGWVFAFIFVTSYYLACRKRMLKPSSEN